MNLYDDLRKQYQTRGLRRDDLDQNPFRQFDAWFEEAIRTRPGEWLEPNAMTLSTAAHGLVTSRTVLLKHHDRQYLTFFSNYQSEKGQQLAANPHASLLFHWAWLGRQVRISGKVGKTDVAVSEEYFSSRPYDARIAATASRQSDVLESRKAFDQARQALEQKYPDGQVPLPDFWGGYQLCPDRWEFWQGRTDRSHDRFRFTRTDADRWQIDRLAP